VLDRLTSPLGGLDLDPELLADLLLADVLVEVARPKAGVELIVLDQRLVADKAWFLGHSVAS